MSERFGWRKSDRRPYARRHRVCDYDGGKLPAASAYYECPLKNISETGVAFLSSRVPLTSEVIISLGPKILMVARVVRWVASPNTPLTPYEIGCEFVRRVDV